MILTAAKGCCWPGCISFRKRCISCPCRDGFKVTKEQSHQVIYRGSEVVRGKGHRLCECSDIVFACGSEAIQRDRGPFGRTGVK